MPSDSMTRNHSAGGPESAKRCPTCGQSLTAARSFKRLYYLQILILAVFGLEALFRLMGH